MAYIGNTPEIGFNTLSVQKFNGDGACTVFSISQPISDPNYLEILVNNVQQEPYAAYDVTSGVITFTEAPSVGANNIQIGYKSQSVVYYNQITSSQLVDGSIGGTKLIDGSVTGNKLGVTSVSGNNIVVGAITGNLIGVGAISGNNIGTGAISANNFAGGGITSNVLASNLSISLTRALESANINVIAPNGNVNIDIANNVVYYFNANSTANITFNLRANTQNTFDSVTTIGQSVTVAMIVKHGTTRHIANVYIDGGLISTGSNSIVYLGNTKPNFQTITNQETNIYGYTVLKTAANTYAVFASNSLFALG